MSFFLVFLAIVLAGALAWFAVDVGRASSRAGAAARTEADQGAEAGPEDGAAEGTESPRPAPLAPRGLEEPPTGLPPVFLPEHPNPEDVDAVRFALAFRGYRMDQVDEVMARLRDRIGVQAALIEVLTAQLKAARGPHSEQHRIPDEHHLAHHLSDERRTPDQHSAGGQRASQAADQHSEQHPSTEH